MTDEELKIRLEEIKNLTLLQAKEMITIDDLSSLTGFRTTYIRKMIKQNLLPYYKPFGKTIYFDKAEINELLHGNKIPSIQEIINEYENRQTSRKRTTDSSPRA